MTIAVTTARKTYPGDDATTVFPVTFYFIIDADLQVILIDAAGLAAVQTLGVEYTLTGAGDDTASGDVTMITAPATGETLLFLRTIVFTQSTDYIKGAGLSNSGIELDIDRLIMLVQQLDEVDDRALKFTSDYLGSIPPEVTDPEADKYLRVNVAGDGLEWVALPTSLDAVDTDEGSFTITGVGFSGAVTATAYYKRVGSLVTIILGDTFAGTSNTTAFTITGLPASLWPITLDARPRFPLSVQDNGSFQFGNLFIGTDGSITISSDAGSGAWTASGTKGLLNGAVLSYHLSD
ncbi:MAG: hypothetical protein KAS32_02180 [Candidatus Peribacteraceae bacterium]|nr:hypothetical protein [Candidatus Peribacteraceae bacterium]